MNTKFIISAEIVDGSWNSISEQIKNKKIKLYLNYENLIKIQIRKSQ